MTALIWNELKRNFRQASYWIFVIIMPVGFYIAFGGFMEAAKEPIGDTGANVSGFIMMQMAFYAACIAAVTLGAQSGSQRASGWYRTLMMTPLTPLQYTISRLVVTAVSALVAVGSVYATGALTFAQLDFADWFITFGLGVVLAVPFSMVGQICGSLFAEDTAQGVASGAIVMSAFLSDLFMPLQGTMLTIGRFMPLYGAKTLVNWAVAEGRGATGLAVPMWQAIANWGAWTILFFVLATLALRTAKERS